MRKMKKGGVQKPLPKPVGIPHAFPGKAEMLDQYENAERMEAENKKNLKSYDKAMKRIPDGEMQSYPETYGHTSVIKQEATETEITPAEAAEAERLMQMTGELEKERDFGISRRAYYKELTLAIQSSDMIMQVLDARDPEASRSSEIEQQVVKEGKRFIQVLNKVDLVPRPNAA
jgi:nuclear GTP-binding protein